LITNISREEYGRLIEGGPIQIKGQGWRINRLRRTYGQGRPGEPIVLFGSAELLEIAVNRGSAKKVLGLNPGDRVVIAL
jgi:S-adenosylmethionine hydrolase